MNPVCREHKRNLRVEEEREQEAQTEEVTGRGNEAHKQQKDWGQYSGLLRVPPQLSTHSDEQSIRVQLCCALHICSALFIQQKPLQVVEGVCTSGQEAGDNKAAASSHRMQ